MVMQTRERESDLRFVRGHEDRVGRVFQRPETRHCVLGEVAWLEDGVWQRAFCEVLLDVPLTIVVQDGAEDEVL